MNRTPPKHHQSNQKSEATAFPKNRGPLLYGFVVLSFLVNFTLYVMTVAPTVTFEDSGELISAAYCLGVPHEPGYPLFTMLGKLFTLLPLGTVAFRVNLMSAFFTALAGVFVFFSTVLLVENIFITSRFLKNTGSGGLKILKYSVGLCAGLLFGTAYTSWEQAVITEVYGLNSFFTSLFVFLTFLLTRQQEERKKRICFYALCMIIGISLTNHTTSAMFIPLIAIYLYLFEKKLLKDFILLVKSFGFFLLGLLPLAYLPIAAHRNPVINWGDPGNFVNFLRVITRHQYGQTPRTLEGFVSQFWVFISELLTKQWFPAVLAFAAAGLIVLFLKSRRVFVFALVFLFFSMPVTTFMTNFDVSTAASAFEHKALVSVFYIPAYLFLSILMGTGIFYALTILRLNAVGSYGAALLLPIVTFVGSGAQNMARVNMRGYFLARDYADNIFKTLPENALLFVHWDPFCFPLIYYQSVEHKRPDLLVLDQMLLKRTWYVQWLQRHHPEFAKQFEKEIKAFLIAVAPFESHKPYNGEILQRCYIGMINAFIDTTLRRNCGVYCTYTPEPAIVRGYRLEPVYSAYKFTSGDQFDTSIGETECDLSAFSDKRFNGDRMKKYFSEYYGNIYGLRGMLLESHGNKARARSCYRLARNLFAAGSQQARFIDAKLAQLGQ